MIKNAREKKEQEDEEKKNAKQSMKEMMKEIGIDDIEDLFKDLPVRSEPINLPEPMSEYELRRHIANILSKNNDELLVVRNNNAILLLMFLNDNKQ